ncbi:hypothetical protein ACFYE8_29585 [Rhizobium leguminosarum]|uniref:hypothetical protein n=1 Tax=Rhizobium leguminosarum TaxID=384 RepID=UPI0036D9C8A2
MNPAKWIVRRSLPGGKTSEVLQAIEAPFDAIALLVDDGSCGIMIFRERFEDITASASIFAIIARKELLA